MNIQIAYDLRGPVQRRPWPLAAAWRIDLGSEQEHQQRHEQAPGQQAAGEVQRAQFGADDVADPEIGRANVRCLERRDASGGQLGHAAPCPSILIHMRSTLLPSIAYLDDEIPRRGKELRRTGQVDPGAQDHGLDEIHRSAESLLAGLVDLGCRSRFRERKVRVLDHDATQQRYEEDAQKTPLRSSRHSIWPMPRALRSRSSSLP